MRKYFRKTGENLFCSDFALAEASRHAPQFLKKLAEEVDFEELWHEQLLVSYKGGAELGASAYRPVLVFKMLFLSYLFQLSEREIERTVNDSICMKQFLGLGLMDKAPDHSTITKFKNRILNYEARTEEEVFHSIFADVIRLAQERKVDLGYTQAIDSTHVIANVNTSKMAHEKKSAEDEDCLPKPPQDPDAVWGVKRVKTVKNTEGGKIKVNESYFGYKIHLSTSQTVPLITSLETTPMSASDNKHFISLVEADQLKGIGTALQTCYTADRAYDDGELHAWLNKWKYKDAIALKKWTKKEKAVEGRLPAKHTVYTTQEEYEEGLRKRYVVEQTNASLKSYHTLKRARYLGMTKMHLQALMSSTAHNLKILVKLWTGVALRATTLPKTHVSLG